MTIQEYVNWMFNSKTEAAYLCIGLTAFFILAALGELFSGLRRGVAKQLLHAIFTAVSLFISFLITEALIKELHTLFESYTLSDMLRGIESVIPSIKLDSSVHEVLAAINPHLAELILTLPIATVLAPVAFLIIFAVVTIVARIIFWIVSKIVPRGEGIVSRVLGMAVGLCEGVLVASLTLLPFAAISDSVGVAAEKLAQSDAENKELTAFYEDYAAPMKATPLFSLTYALGGEIMLDEFAKVDVGYGEIDMREELGCAVDIISSLTSLKDVNWASLTPEQKNSVVHMIDSIRSSEYFTDVFAGVFVTVANITDNIEVGEEGELLSSLYSDMLTVFKTSTKQTVSNDLLTFKNMYFMLHDENILSAYNGEGGPEDVLDALIATDDAGDTVISRLIGILSDNPRTSPLVTTLTKLSVSIMAQSLGLGEEAAEVYENVKDGINGILSINHEDYATPDEYKEAVADTLNATLSEQGINLDSEIIDGMADFVEKNFKEHDELSDEDINKIILSYYDAFVSLRAN